MQPVTCGSSLPHLPLHPIHGTLTDKKPWMTDENSPCGLPGLNRPLASGATLPGLVARKPSGIPVAVVSRPRCGG